MSRNAEVTPEEYQEYDNLLMDCFRDTKEHINSDTWIFNKEVNDVKIYTRNYPGSSYTMIKSVTKVKAPPEFCFNTIVPCKDINESTPSNEREGLEERFLINYDPKDPSARAFMYCRTPAPMMFVAPRDFLIYRKKIEEDGIIYYLHTSIKNDRLVPEKEGCVRGVMRQNGYVFMPDPENPEQTIMSFIMHTEINGNIPTLIYNKVAVNQGAELYKLRDLCENEYKYSI